MRVDKLIFIGEKIGVTGTEKRARHKLSYESRFLNLLVINISAEQFAVFVYYD